MGLSLGGAIVGNESGVLAKVDRFIDRLNPLVILCLIDALVD